MLMCDADVGVQGPEKKDNREGEDDEDKRSDDKDEVDGAGSVVEATAVTMEAENGIGGDEDVRMRILGGGGQILVIISFIKLILLKIRVRNVKF
jgi:hypothetical protein